MLNRDFFRSKLMTAGMVFLAVSAVYLYTFPSATIFYAAVVLAHAFVGVIAVIGILWKIVQLLRTGSLGSRIGWILVAGGGLIGAALIYTGTSRPEWKLLYTHIG